MKSKRKLLKYRGTSCLNCHQALDKSEAYCHRCGQLNSTKRLTAEDFFNEFFSGIFAYDSRLYRTLRALLFRPGKISKDYIEGKRQRYANPYKFYLSVSIVFFVLWGLTSEMGLADTETASGLEPLTVSQRDSILVYQLLDQLNPDLRNRQLEDIKVPESQLDSMNFWPATKKKMEIFTKYYSQTEESRSRLALQNLSYEPSFFNRWLYDKTVDLATFDPDIFFNYLLGKLPFIIFFFLPIFALFIWLLYVRRSYTYMEHLIFTFHNQTVLFVVSGTGLLIDYFTNFSWGLTIAGLIFLFYLYKAMRHFYEQSRVKTFVKFVILNGLFFILAILVGFFSVLASFAII